jgi:hypothetical protein
MARVRHSIPLRIAHVGAENPDTVVTVTRIRTEATLEPKALRL